jgi:hypothetical protein
MSYITDAWGTLKFSAGTAGNDILANMSFRYLKNRDGRLVYRNNRAYVSVPAHVGKQVAMQTIERELNNYFPNKLHEMAKQKRADALRVAAGRWSELIGKREGQSENWGRIQAEGGEVIVAKDKYGTTVCEALMLHYDAETPIEVEEVIIVGDVKQTKAYKTKTVCLIDLAPQVSIQSGKNLVMTTVQGRDYTRKELVSGGDLTFSVSGNIVSNEMDVYPANDVRKFIQIAQYGGVVQVSHPLFSQFNVGQIIIKDFQLNAQECKNMQPYSLTCVAVEPDEEVTVKKDTISVLNDNIARSPAKSWYKASLEKALMKATMNAPGTASSLANAGLDILIPNI